MDVRAPRKVSSLKATSWYRNFQQLSQHFKVYVVDVIGKANKSKPTRPIKSLDDLRDCIAQL